MRFEIPRMIGKNDRKGIIGFFVSVPIISMNGLHENVRLEEFELVRTFSGHLTLRGTSCHLSSSKL
jgi:hypothetical protein